MERRILVLPLAQKRPWQNRQKCKIGKISKITLVSCFGLPFHKLLEFKAVRFIFLWLPRSLIQSNQQKTF